MLVSDRNPAWPPDRRTLAIHPGGSTEPGVRLYVISASDGTTIRPLVPGVSPEWLDAAAVLYVGELGHDVWAVDLMTLVIARITDLGAGVTVSGMSWHPSDSLAIGYGKEGDRHWIATVPASSVAAARAPGGALVGPDALTFRTDPTVNAVFPGWAPAADRLTLMSWQPGSPSRGRRPGARLG